MELGAFLFWGVAFGSFILFLALLLKQLRSDIAVQREWLLNFSLAAVVCLSMFLLLELSFRIRHLLIRDISFFSSLAQYQHNEFGWIGKQAFGDTHTEKKKVFFLGDSFTQGMGVDEDRMYYRLVASDAGAEPFVYAGAGYGTLQQLLVLRRYLKELQPDLIVLQVCTNDFINNYWQLDSASYHNNTLLPRPYWMDGKIEYHYPRSFSAIRSFLPSHSRFFHFLFTKLELLLLSAAKAGYLQSVEEDILRQGKNLPSFAAAVAVTDKLVQDFKSVAGNIPIVAFSVDKISPYSEEFAAIFAQNGIPFVQDVEEAVRREESNGGELRLEDGVHWNEEGQQVAGVALYQALKAGRFLD